jgi:beta-glucosidase
VQLYTRQQRSRVKQPLRQLRAFERVHLEPGEERIVHFALSAADLAFWDVTQGRFVIEAASHTVLVGRSSVDIRLAATVAVEGSPIPPRSLADPLPATAFDDYAGIELRDATPTAGEVVSAAEGGAWIVFEGLDLGPGVGRCRARVCGGEVTLRLDDPLAGPVVGVARAHGRGGRYAWEEPTIELTGAAGEHDLYVVFSAPGVGLESLTFLP